MTLRICDAGPPDSPETRCLERGPDSLSSLELLILVTRCGPRVGKKVMEKVGSFRALSHLPPNQVLQMLQARQAVALIAALELSRRMGEEHLKNLDKLVGADDAYRFLRPRLARLQHEVFAVIFLTQKHGVLAYRELFRGSVASSTVHPREVMREVLKENAAAVILAHNHPSGSIDPSPDDIRLTEDLKDLLQRLEVRVLDHIIVGCNGYYSFAREGMLGR